MGCRNHTDGWQILEASESIMEENPDSAFFLLSSIDALKLRKGEGPIFLIDDASSD